MKNKWYALKLKDSYVHNIDHHYNNDTQVCVSTTPHIHDCKLMNDEMRENWIMSLVKTTNANPDDIKSVKMEVESTIVDESETKDFGIRFANGTFAIEMQTDGVCTTKPTMTESESLDHAGLFCKEHADTIVKLLKTMIEIDMLPDSLAGEITIVPIKREYTNIQEI